MPIEGQPMHVFFSVTGTDSAPRTGWVSVKVTIPGGGTLDESSTDAWSVFQLTSGETANGVVTFTAPTAAANNVIDLFYFEDWQWSGNTRTAGASLKDADPLSFSTGEEISVSLDSIYCSVTRIRGDGDTISSGIEAWLGANDPGPVTLGPGSFLLDHGQSISGDSTGVVYLYPGVSPDLSYRYRVANISNEWGCAGDVADDTFAFTSDGVDALTLQTGSHTEAREYHYVTPWNCNASDYWVTTTMRRERNPWPDVTPHQVRLKPNHAFQFAATGLASPVTWSVSDPTMGSVDSFGTFTASPNLNKDGFVNVSAAGSAGTVVSAYVGLAP
jgi:hypothetical protein